MAQQQTSATVAVVEDDASCRIALGRLLRAEGFQTELFDSAEAYMHAPHTPPPLCVIVDIRLPGISGLELQRQLQATGTPTPVIVTTAAHEHAIRARAERNGCAAFFSKPVDTEALLATIVQLCTKGQ